MKKLLFCSLLFLLCLSTTIFANPRIRPSHWATPVIGAELDNFYQVDDKLFRSEQPGVDSFLHIQKFGIKETLNLREYHTDTKEAQEAKLSLHHVKMNAAKVNEQQITKALELIKNSKGPILVHCWHGSDRTGVVVASYRIVFQDWTKESAIDEMRNGGYGYHSSIYPQLIDEIKNLNVQDIKQKLGL